ncbi:MAG: DUF4954 family protein, partial [Phycisphaerae bacterium]|nr:DUF4954 family protein [Phycisphaerae bacterium]
LDVRGENMEAGRRDVCILKAGKAWGAYRDMLHYYGAFNCFDWLDANPDASLAEMHTALAGPRVTEWFNLGGQLVPLADVDALRADIRDGKLTDWHAIHAAYDTLWQAYPLARQQHAYATLCELVCDAADEEASTSCPSGKTARPPAGGAGLDASLWPGIVEKAVEVQRYICDQTRNSRAKDYDNPFRRMTYSSDADMQAVLGSVDDNSFVEQIREETQAFTARAERLRATND